MKKFLSLIFVFMFLLSGINVNVYSEESLKNTDDANEYGLQKVVYSIEELSKYLANYRIEYQKNKHLYRHDDDDTQMREFYNALDCIYLPKGLDQKLITKIGLYNNYFIIYFKEENNYDRESFIRLWFKDYGSLYDYTLNQLDDKEQITKYGLIIDIKSITFNNLNEEKEQSKTLKIISNGFIPPRPGTYEASLYNGKDIFWYYFKEYGYDFYVDVYEKTREEGYQYCNLEKIPLNVSTEPSAGESVEEISYPLC